MSSQRGKNIKLDQVDFDPFGSVPDRSVLTTESQREILTNIKFGGDQANRAYNESITLLLRGPFDLKKFRMAFAMLVQRHEALRAVFSADGLTMTVRPTVDAPVRIHDISGMSHAEQKRYINDLRAEESHVIFDISNGPLFRSHVVSISKDEIQIILTFHHVVCDGWSLGVIMQDLGKLYSSLVLEKNLDIGYPESFIDWIEKEHEFSVSKRHDEIMKFWKDCFRSVPEFYLPSDKKRPAVRSFSAKRVDVKVPDETYTGIRELSRTKGVSLITTLLAALECYLFRITGSKEVVVGLPAAGQAETGADYLVGHCVNLLPLKASVDGGMSFLEYLKERKTRLLDFYDHQRVTFGRLIQELRIRRDPSRIPLAPVSFNVDFGLTDGVHFENCEYEFITNPRLYENFELFINAADSGSGMVLECTYNTDLFSESYIRNRTEEFLVFLQSILNDPAQLVEQIAVISEDQLKLLVDDWNGKTTELNRKKCVHDFFTDQVADDPQKIAIDHGGEQTSYGQLDQQSDRICSILLKNGIRPGDLVGVFMARSAGLIASLYGILKAGAAYVPLDPEYPDNRIRYMLNDSDCTLVLTDADRPGLFDKLSRRVINLTTTDEDEVLEMQELCTPEDLAYLMYTSGSTGDPKGVAVEHRNVTALIEWAMNKFSNAELRGVVTSTSVCFDLSVFEIFCTLSAGGTCLLTDNILDISDLRSEIEPTLVNTVPTAISTIVAAGISIPSSVTTFVFCGEFLPQQLVDDLYSSGTVQKVYDMYGPTEDTVYSTCALREKNGNANIGRALSNTNVWLVDNNMQLVPPGIPGEILLSGNMVARGYHERGELTSQKFIYLNIEKVGNVRVYRTGDFAKYDQAGNLEFLGRNDEQIKFNGFRIELGEIESFIRRISGISDCVCDLKTTRSGDHVIAAFMVHDDNGSSHEEIRRSLQLQLPHYMIPGVFEDVSVIPRTPNGKIDRNQLRLTEDAVHSGQHGFKEPEGPYEEMLSMLYSKVLKVEKVGRFDNFFELGGHSLIGVRLMNEIEHKVGVKAELTALFKAPTISELALVLSGHESSVNWSIITKIKDGKDHPPLFCLHMHNGNIHRWNVLKRYFPEEQMIYAIQPKGLDPKQEPHSNIEDMASDYVNEVRKLQPKGPYRLLGFCFSAMVAFEMTHLLEIEGEKVEFLGMINNYAPPENPVMYKVKTELNKFMKMELGEKFQYAIEKNVNLGKKLIFRSGNFTGHDTKKDDSEQVIGHDLRTIHSLALLNYHPRFRVKSDLVIIRTDEPVEPFFNEHLGWDRLIGGQIKTHVIKGCDNDTIITDEPYNRELSETIGRHMELLNKGNSGALRDPAKKGGSGPINTAIF